MMRFIPVYHFVVHRNSCFWKTPQSHIRNAVTYAIIIPKVWQLGISLVLGSFSFQTIISYYLSKSIS